LKSCSAGLRPNGRYGEGVDIRSEPIVRLKGNAILAQKIGVAATSARSRRMPGTTTVVSKAPVVPTGTAAPKGFVSA
jgi:hypothetical protein